MPNVTYAGALAGTWFAGVGDPQTLLGTDGDFYLDIAATATWRREGGTWALQDVAAGGVSDGDKGDITVSSSGTVWTVDNGAVTNAKLANMAASTFKARKTGSTGAPEDATATEATALLDAMVGDSGSGGTKGLAPAPGSGDAAAGKFLAADGTWQTPGSVAGSAGFAYYFGDGSDGDVTFDGSSAVTGWSRSGSVYTFGGGVIPQYDNVTIDVGVTVNTGQIPLFINGTLDLNGSLVGANHSSKNASGGTAGTGTTGSGTAIFYTGNATAGGNGTTGAGQAGGNSGTACLGGGGGTAGSNAGGAGAAGGTVTLPTNAAGGIAYAWSLGAIQSAITRTPGSTVSYVYGTGGGGGRGNGAQTGGGGGGGGSVVGVFARTIAGTGTMDAAGGNGAQSATSGCSGGGGGGGGCIWILTTTPYVDWTFTTSVAGGTAGAANGTGNAGVDGNPGRVIYMILAA